MKALLGLVGIVVLASVISGCSASEGGSADGSPAEEVDRSEVIGDDIGARVICQQFVEDRLKSPATADFSGEAARHIRGKKWIVAGDVDSENSFGAMIRNQYTCKVRFVGDDRWQLVSMRGLSN